MGGSFTVYYEKDGEMNAGDYRIFWSKSANGEYKEVKLDEVSGYYQIRNVQSDVYVKIYGRDGFPVSNEAIEATEARAYAQANKIIVVTHEPMDVQIVSMAGAVVGNAGAFGGAVGDSVSEVKVLTERGIVCIGADKLHFSYRKTDGLPEGIITGVVFRLKRADPVMLAECAAGYDERRRSSQPTGRSAGSTFLACNGISAGYYIERAGLKGTRIGGARVSDKHANFIIVDGGCANDIRLLTDLIKLKVYAEFGVRLKEEINYIGEF